MNRPPLTPDEAEDLARDVVPIAMQLIGVVREEGPDATADLLANLTPEQAYALPIILAAMVPDDRTPEDLLSWYSDRVASLTKRRRSTKNLPQGVPQSADANSRLQPCPSPAAYKRHLHRGERPCVPCQQASTRYRKSLYEARKAKRGAAA